MIAHNLDSEKKRYERLDRHVRTSATINELVHWDGVRVESILTDSHHLCLRKEIEARLRQLTEVKPCSAK